MRGSIMNSRYLLQKTASRFAHIKSPTSRCAANIRLPWITPRPLPSLRDSCLTHSQDPQLLRSLKPRVFYSSIPSPPSPTISNLQDNTKTTNVNDAQKLPPYQPPTSGLLAILPSAVVPYAELIRLDKPTGTYYLFFPCLFSTLLAAPIATPIAPLSTVIGTTALFLTGAVVMRGAGCTINDLWDRNLDPHVARTRLRPIARKAITPQKAVVFTGAQLLVGLSVLLQFPLDCLWYGVPSLLLVTTYPLAKRVTYYPQFVLGLTFSWGAFMGFPALGVDLLQNAQAMSAAALLYASNIAWTVLYDMIYAHMDIKDDAKVGIKSIALRHDKETKQVLSGLAIAQISLLGAAGYITGAGPLFYLGSCVGGAGTLAIMISKVNLKSVANCWWWFRYGCWFTGVSIAAGLFGDYLSRLIAEKDHVHTTKTDRELQPAWETIWRSL
jgi:4-hydroxybenzoate polyprenyltransferase